MMENPNSIVSVEDKKEFIRWFLKRYKMKRREAVWILNYLVTHEKLLSNVSFVDDVRQSKRGMLISVVNGNDQLPPFKFYKDNIETTDAEKAFHDMRLHSHESLHIQLNFNGKYECPQYALAEEPHNSNEKLSPAVLEEAEKIMADLQRQMLLREIDKALDEGDQKLFMELWEQLNEVGVRYSAYVN